MTFVVLVFSLFFCFLFFPSHVTEFVFVPRLHDISREGRCFVCRMLDAVSTEQMVWLSIVMTCRL